MPDDDRGTSKPVSQPNSTLSRMSVLLAAVVAWALGLRLGGRSAHPTRREYVSELPKWCTLAPEIAFLYSYRKARNGSTRVALRAGKYPAINATNAIPSVAKTMLAGSLGEIP
jgi:hypothetical protein